VLCFCLTAVNSIYQINVREYRREIKKNGQPRETKNIGYTRRRKTKQKHNTICVGNHYTQTNTNNSIITWVTLRVSYKKQELLTLRELLSSPRVFGGVRVTHLFVFLCCPIICRKTKQKHNTICVGNHYTQTNTNNVNKTWVLPQTTGGLHCMCKCLKCTN
jgi:hypothetical protein